jgi:hypothetical protein
MGDSLRKSCDDSLQRPGAWRIKGKERAGAGMQDSEFQRRLEALRSEHRDLDAAIDALLATSGADQLQIARLKKRKLRLRDEIALCEDQLIPDIIA